MLKGGSDKIFFDHSRIMRQNGHSVIPFAPKDDQMEDSDWSEYFPKAVDMKDPDIRDLPSFFYNVNASSNLKELLTRKEIDIAHLHIYYGRLTMSVISRLSKAGIPIVQTLHDYRLICPNSNMICNEKICEACNGDQFWKAWTKNCNDNSFMKTTAVILETYLSKILGSRTKIDKFIAVSNFLKDKLIEFGMNPDKIVTIHNPVDVSHLTPEYDIGDYITYFGRIDKLKGIRTLIEVAIEMDLKLKIIGTGPEEENLKKISSVSKKIEFMGYQRGNDLFDIIKGGMFNVCPSICYDIFPTTILESFALGKPVIGSNIGGIPELIDNGLNGYLFEPGNSDDLADKISIMMNSSTDLAKMGRSARTKVENQFNEKIYYSKIEELYNSLL